MPKQTFLTESDLANWAKKSRKEAGKSKADAARELGVSTPSIYNAEERPEMSLAKLRIRMIKTYSKHEVVGPVYYLKCK